MIGFYIKMAFRNISSNRLIYGGSLFSVSIGAICISLLFSFVYNEFTMNDMHKHKKDIYVMTVQPSPKAELQGINASLFFNFDYRKYPELERCVSLFKYNRERLKISLDNRSFYPEILVADSNFFKVFDFRLIVGNVDIIMNDPNSAILTEKYAQQLFGNKNPIGNTFKTTEGNEKVYTVNGIVATPPSNSSITFECILPYKRFAFNKSGVDIILTKPNFNKNEFLKKIATICQKHPQFSSGKMGLIPLNETYFNKGKDNQFQYIFSRYGDKKVCNVLIIIILLLLVITTLNFTNLQVVSINSTLKNLGINKINGAHKKQLIANKCYELLLLIVASTLLTTFIYFFTLPLFNQITNGVLAPSVKDIVLLNTGIILIISLIAAIYPLIIILNVPILNTLKKQVFSSNYLISQKVILTFQYVLAIAILISSIVVTRQLYMMLHKDLGFNSNSVVRVKILNNIPSVYKKDLNRNDINEQHKKDSIRQTNYHFVNHELASSPFIESFTQGDSPLRPYSMPTKITDNTDNYTDQNWISVSPGYEKVLGLNVIKGRFFDKNLDKNREFKVIVNQAALKYWSINQMNEKNILNYYWNEGKFEIIGVVQDYNYAHLAISPRPLIMYDMTGVASDYLIRFKKSNIKAGLDFIHSLSDKVNPNQDFTYTFIDDEIDALYKKEKQLSKIYILFTLIALVITSIGLFTIALYEAQRRTKEIGIRKVNGAKVTEVLAMLNKDFIKWVAISFLIACPIAWYAMHQWLQNFAYKTELSWWVFALAGTVALAVAVLTVSWQSWRVATRNPVEALRYE